MRIACTLAFLTLCLWGVRLGYAQPGDILIERLSTADGLSHDNVTSIVQDQQGFLWIGTWDGLNRYDGSTFKIFAYDPVDPASLSHSQAEAVYVDRSGTLWVGTHGGGLNRFDPATETFTHYRHDPGDPASLSNNEVRVLYEDRAGTLWVGAGGWISPVNPAGLGGLNRFDPETDTFVRYLHDPGNPATLMDDRVGALFEDTRGTFWVGTVGNVLHQMDREAGTFERFVVDPAHPARLSRPEHTSLPEDCDLRNCGIITFVHEDPSGILWIGAHGGGLFRYDPATGLVRHHEAKEEDPHSLANTRLWNIAAARDGTIWLANTGFETPGLYRVVVPARPIPHYRHTPGDPSSLSSDAVWGLHVDEEGVLWAGTMGGGLNRLSPGARTFEHYRHVSGDSGSLSSDSIMFFHEDRSAALWVGTVDGGLNRFDRATGRVKRYAYDPRNPGSLSAPFVTAILEDRQGVLWVGTATGGLNRLSPGARTFKHYRHDGDDPTSLPSDLVTSLYEDRQGVLWVGTDGGLSRFDRADETFTAYLGTAVTSLYEDRAGRFWVGAWVNGLQEFDREKGRSLVRFTTAQGLPSGSVAAIVEDDAGRLWVSTMKRVAGGKADWPVQMTSGGLMMAAGGLARFDPETRSFRVLTEADGLPEMAFYPLSATRGPGGTLYFGGSSGFIALDPASITEPAAPQVVLTGLRLFNETVKPGPGTPLAQSIYLAREIVLRHEQHDIMIDYAGLDYRGGGALRYQYQLEHHDEGWVEARGQRSARYSRLRPGRYVFRARAARPGGAWGEASIAVVLLPPWWRTWWAYGLYGVLFAAGVFAVDRIQRRRLIRRERARAALREQELLLREKDLRAEAAEAWSNYLQSENQRQTQELEAARTLQLSMLPERVPEHPTVELAAYMKTATEVGGDYYDFDLADDGTLTIAIGDATGHGASAGTMVTATKGILGVLSGEEDLEQVLMAASEAVRRMHLPKLYMALALVRLRDHTLELAGAGMPPALVYRAASGCIKEVPLKGMPLGSPGVYPYRRQCMLLSPGDTVVLMSDGFPELFGASGQRLGYERMPGLFAEAAGRSPEEVIAHLMETAKAWCNGQVPDDDMTFVVMKVKA